MSAWGPARRADLARAFLVAAALFVPTGARTEELPTCALLVDRSGGEERLSLRLNDLTVRDALSFLLTGSGLSVIGEESLGVAIEGNLDSVSVGEAVHQIISAAGFSFSVEGAALHIRSRGSETFLVNEIAVPEQTFWDDLEKNLPDLLTPAGTFVVNRRAAIVTVEDTPAGLDRAGEFLRRLEDDLSRQIHLQAEILESTLDDETQSGIDWRVLARGWDNVRGGTSGGGLLEQNTVGQAQEVFQLGLIRTDRLSLLVDLLEERGKLKVLSRPSVTTVGNQPAVFRATEQVPFYTIQTFASTGGTPYIQYSIDYREAGVVLECWGRVGDDGVFVLKVHPMVSTVTDYTPSLPNLPPQPVIDLREMETVVRMREGETLVVGGLIQEREQRETRGVPFLSSIPGLGWFFRNTHTVLARQELTLVLTPRSIRDAPRERITREGRTLIVPTAWPSGARGSLAAVEHDAALRAWRGGRPERAAEHARRALQILPDLDVERLNLAFFQAAAGDLAGARATWESFPRDGVLRPLADVGLQALDLVEERGIDPKLEAGPAAALLPEARAASAYNRATQLSIAAAPGAARALLEETAATLPAGAARRLLEERAARIDTPPNP